MTEKTLEIINAEAASEIDAQEARRQWTREYYQKNKKHIKARQKQYREVNKEKVLEREREYRKKNPDKVKQWNENYWKRKAAKQKKVD